MRKAVSNWSACMHGFAFNESWLFARYPENTQLARRLQAGGRLSSLSPPLSLVLVRSAGQIILGLWAKIFEGIWEVNLLQSGSVGGQSSARRRQLPLKMPPDRALEVESWWTVCACVCVSKAHEKDWRAKHLPGCTAAHRTLLLHTKVISGWLGPVASH